MAGPEVADAAASSVLTAASSATVVERSAGGKARGLFALTSGGVPVPCWAVVSLDVFRRLRSDTGLDVFIADQLEGLTPDSHEDSLKAAAERIATALVNAELDSETREAIAEAYAHVGAGAVAVRSSAIGEDSGRFSFAGQHTTLLNVIGLDPVVEAVQTCWASAWSATALRYRMMNRLPLQGVEMAVVIQAIVAADKSGVMFTVNPATGDGEELVISATYGLGEAIVSGAVDPDTIVLSRTSGVVRDETLGSKDERLDPLPQGGCATRALSSSERLTHVLTPAELSELHDLAAKLECLMHGPQDVEWALAGGELWILQSRPITGPQASTPSGELRLWDNSNIIESYGDIVAPLTFSFARHAYHRVYRQYCELLGVPQRQLTRIEEWLPQLLGYFDGRVYYNLLNWYRLARLIPFYSINRRVLEMSMGAEPLDEQVAEQQHPYIFRNRIEGLITRVRVAIHFFWYFTTIHRLVNDFVEQFYLDYDALDALDYEGRPAHEIYSMFVDMERRLLVRWGRMIMLEYTVGLSVGTLYGLTQRWLPDAPEWLLFAAVKVSPDVESVQPLRRLDEIAEAIAREPVLREQIHSLPAEQLDGVLRGSSDPSAQAVVKQIDRYLSEFGYRNANELKLEEPDLNEDPTTFFDQLKSAVGRQEVREATARQERPAADDYLAANLHGWRRRIFELQRRRVQRLLSARERVRFCRTRIFGLSRRMFRAAGNDLARTHVLEQAHDIFYLRLEELRGCFEGTVGHRELGDMIRLRKEQEALNREHEVPHRFWTRGDVYWGELERAWAEASTGEAPQDGVLQGTPCSPGVVRGEAHVIERPVDVEGGVMVTYRTDPGWVGALRSASALLIERGSPLTHVAVVARELGIPTVVQIPGLTQRVHSGATITVDGGGGTVTLPATDDAGGHDGN